MARTCGIRLGPRRFELVVLEGSARKHRITGFLTGEFPLGGEDALADAAAVLKEAAREQRIPHDAVCLAIDTGLAAFRTLKMPAIGEDKLDEVIKFEVEGQLPQWNIDDVVVDFLPLDVAGDEERVLVTALPKSDLRRELEVCERAGIEPQEAELEATAMVNAALNADICHVDDAQVLVHIGETSSAVVVMDGGKVRVLRAIHIGALSHDVPAAPKEAAAEETPQAAEAGAPAPDPEEEAENAQRRLEQAVSRIRRELGRTLSGARTANPIEAVYVCGWELPDLVGTQLHDIPVYELDVFEEDSGQPAQGTAPLVVAYGAALRMLGAAPVRASLRREELRYTGAFERVELPLAVAALLLVTWLSVLNIFEFQQVRLRERDVDVWGKSAFNFILGNPREGNPGNLSQAPPDIARFIEAARVNQTPYSQHEELIQLRRMLLIEIDKLNKELGRSGEITQPQSALEGMALVLGLLESLRSEIGRVSIRNVDARYVGGRLPQDDRVEVKLELTFFADTAATATRHLEEYARRLREQPWVTEVSSRGSTEIEGGKGISTETFAVTLDLSKEGVEP